MKMFILFAKISTAFIAYYAYIHNYTYQPHSQFIINLDSEQEIIYVDYYKITPQGLKYINSKGEIKTVDCGQFTIE